MESQTPEEQVRFYFTDTDEVFLTDSKHIILACRYAIPTRLLGYLDSDDPLDAIPKFTRVVYTSGIRVVPDHTACRVYPENCDLETERTKSLCQRWYWPKEYRGAYPIVSEVQLMDAAVYLQHLQYFNEGQLRENEKIRTVIDKLEKGRTFNSDKNSKLNYFLSQLRGLSLEEESEEVGQPSLEEKVGANTIHMLESNSHFKELSDFLREHPRLADEKNLLHIYYTAVLLGLNGRNPERYAQAVLNELKSKGKDIIYLAPEVVREISTEKAKWLSASEESSKKSQGSVVQWLKNLLNYKPR